jgi:N-sulfoglucosamine sulfohydrolase
VSAAPIKPDDIREPMPFGMPTQAENRKRTAHYLNAVARLDTGLGLLLDELAASGFASNTLVVYVGDNGVAAPHGKTTSYELGVRVRLRGPSGNPRGIGATIRLEYGAR